MSYLAQQVGSQPPQHESQQLWQWLWQQRRNRPAKAANGRIRGRQQLWQQESQQSLQQLLQHDGAAQQVVSQHGLAQQVTSQHGLAQQVTSQQAGAQHDEAQQRPNRPALASWAARNDNAATANKAMTRDFMGSSPILGSLTDTENTKLALQLPAKIGDSVADP